MAASRIFDEIPEDVLIAVTELTVAGLNAFVIYGIFKTCKTAETILNILREAPALSVGHELVNAVENTESRTLQYAAIRGKVLDVEGKTIPPSRNGVPSVIRLIENQEMRSKLSWSGSRYPFIGRAYETLEFHPFSLGKMTDCPISINFQKSFNPLPSNSSGNESPKTFGIGGESQSPLLMIKDVTVPDTSDLLQTFPTYFEKSNRKESRLSDLFDYIFGIAAINGIQKTEKLLPVNEVITALGRVTKTGDGLYTLTAPSVPNAIYMLSVKPLEEIIEDYAIRTALGSFLIFILTCGGVLLVIDGVKRLKQGYDVMYPRDNQSQISPCDNSEMLLNESTLTIDDQQLCVICQTQPRNVVLITCGHIVTCESCSRRLNGRCPVCRQPVQSFVRFYVC